MRLYNIMILGGPFLAWGNYDRTEAKKVKKNIK